MAAGRGKWWVFIVSTAIIALILCGIIGFRIAVGTLKRKAVEALGPDSEISEIRVGWSGVVIDGLRIKGGSDWPANDTLRAERVTLVPSLWSILSRHYRVHSITILNPYLSLYRTKGGKLLAVPSLLSEHTRVETPSVPVSNPIIVTIGHIILQDGVVEFYDASVKKHPLKVRLEQIQANLNDIIVPTFKERSTFTITGLAKGIHQDGRVDISGWAQMSSKDSSVKLQLRSVDLTAIQPYLIKASDTAVRQGTLDLDLQSDIRDNHMKAPGKITITDLKLAPGKGVMSTFMGVPRDAVLAFLKDKGNRISLSFVLEGDVDNPKFSLNETISERLAVSMADFLKVSIGGVAEGAASLGEKGVEAATGVAKGVGNTVLDLFGSQKKH
ncbi:MAG TPA: DUF748 domain-containing protein [Desulfomonilia bacterium]|nr:DUF748 domain-containing protein [Desulfomonilia bacterium]